MTSFPAEHIAQTDARQPEHRHVDSGNEPTRGNQSAEPGAPSAHTRPTHDQAAQNPPSQESAIRAVTSIATALLPINTLQKLLWQALGGAHHDQNVISKLTRWILQHPELQILVQLRAYERRGIRAIAPYDPEHQPGVFTIRIIKRNGKARIVFSPSDSDYVQAQYYLIGIIGPIAESVVHGDTCAYITGRGTESAIFKAINRTQRTPQCVWWQLDIQDCFNTIPTSVVIAVFPPQARKYIALVQQRHRELNSGASGLPQGHPISAAVVNVVINFLLAPIRHGLNEGTTVISYSDDITPVGPRDETMRIGREIEQTLRDHGMKLNPEKSRRDTPAQGRTMTLLGYELQWRAPQLPPVIGPRRRAYAQLTGAIANSLDRNHVEAIMRGWKNAYRLSNDPTHLHRMQDAIRDGFNRWHQLHTTRPMAPTPGDSLIPILT